MACIAVEFELLQEKQCDFSSADDAGNQLFNQWNQAASF